MRNSAASVPAQSDLTEPSQMATANPDPSLGHAAELEDTHAWPRGRRWGALLLPQDLLTPILRAHISADSLPHPNPQPTLALGPVPSPSPRQKQSHQ